MKINTFFEKVKELCKRIGRRNFIIAGAVLLIGAAVCLNLIFFAGTGKGSAVLNKSGSGGENDVDAYFASSVIDRQRARDEAMEVLQSVVDNAASEADAKNQALSDISRMALEIEREANIETLVKSKGFAECVAVINGDAANVIVKSDGLLANEISQIMEIVYEQAGIKPVNVKIIEKGV